MESVNSLKDSHTVADIVSMVSNEIPINSGTAYQEAQSVSKLIVDSVLNPVFLDPLAFLTSAGNEAKILDPMDLKTRPLDITYVRFRCTMNGSSVDVRIINVPDLNFHFCLQLPQHSYDDTTGVVQLIDSAPSIPVSTSSIARPLDSCFAASGAKQ